MPLRRAPLVLAALAVTACLPDSLAPVTESDAGTAGTADPTVSEPTTGGGEQTGLFACSSPPCTLLLVSQTLDDRVDVFDVTATPSLRGRIGLDLKPDPSGQQLNTLLDEPYELALTPTDLLVTLGHYPAIDQGSLLRFPRASFAELAPGGSFTAAEYFNANDGSFSAGVEALVHAEREGIFLLPHPSGRMLVGVFANDLQATEWTTPSRVLVVDPDFSIAPGSFDLGALTRPCVGGWQLAGLDAAMSRVAIACDGSDSVAVLTLPADFATAAPSEVAANISGCGVGLLGDPWTTQFVVGDGAGGMLAVQSQLGESPRLWRVGGDCSPGKPSQEAPAGFEQVRLLRQPVLLRPAGDGADALWLVAAGAAEPGVVIVRGGATPTLCGRVSGLDGADGLDAANNTPWALALDASGEHLALGAGPPSNPELSAGRGQVLWAKLDRSKLDTCEVTASEVVDLNAGRFQAGDPSTWVRAPNVLVIAELTGGGA